MRNRFHPDVLMHAALNDDGSGTGGGGLLGAAPPADPPAAAPEPAPVDPPAAAAPPADPPAPVDYKFEFGENVVVADNTVAGLTDFAKKYNLPAEAAAELAPLVGGTSNAWAEKHVNEVKTMVDGWAEQAKSDPEFGGEKFNENLNIANAGLAKLDTSGELTKMLVASGMSNHPEMVRLLWKVGKIFADDSVAGGQGGAPTADETSTAKMLYPNNP